MAKKFDHLYERITSSGNLFAAFQKAARGKRGQPPVARFDFDLEDNIFALQEELHNKTYRPGAYCSFYILDPKRRLVSAAPFRDRVAHHALCNVLEPIFERTFIGDCYANRLGKGNHRAVRRAQEFARQYPFVLHCDVCQFFPSIDIAILRGILQRKIADADTLWLCEQILASGEGVLAEEYQMVFFPGDDPATGEGQGLFAACRPRGLPIGNLTSQFWANVYLNELDQFVKRKLQARAYLRYVDDFLLFDDDKNRLWEWKRAIENTLAALRLTLHERESTVYPSRAGIPFLGFRIYPSHILLQRKNGMAFQKRFSRWKREMQRGQLDHAKLNERVLGWVAHAKHGDTWGLRRALLCSVRKHEGIADLYPHV
jgi:retron-type reverse transcriptase